jgi:outer membrane protein insertion porin family
MGSGKKVGIGLNSSKYQTSANLSYTNPYYTEDGVSRGFSIFYRETDFDEVNVASYRTDVLGANMSFGYPLSETQRLRFSLGGKDTSLKAGSRAVQEIIGSPRFPYPGIDEEFLPDHYISEYATQDPETGEILTGDVVTNMTFPEDQGLLFDTEDGFIDIYGDSFTDFTLSASWVQSSLNRGQLATRGASQSFGVEFTVPGSDLEYYKVSYNAQYFMPVARAFTLRFRGELGYGDGYGDNEDLPFFENYFSGGFGSVRGFKSNTLGPRSTPAEQYTIQQPIQEDGTLDDVYAYCLYNEDDPASLARCSGLSLQGQGNNTLGHSVISTNDDRPFGGNVLIEGSIELLFPLPFIKDQRTMRSAFFIDVGNVFSTNCGKNQINCFGPEDFSDELRYSVGVGLTWITGFGPLTFSLAKPLNDDPADQTEVFQFSLGQFF